MIKLKFFIIALFISNLSLGQNKLSKTDSVFAFFEYKLKNEIGMEDAFNTGYERDLEWHKSQNDQWTWIGWYVTNGSRRGYFIDATPNHLWSDFDNWNVNTAENSRLNKIHWVPYVESSDGSYKVILNEFSSYTRDWFKTTYLQVFHVSIDLQKEILFSLFLKDFSINLKNKIPNSSFVWMKTASGGLTTEYSLFLTANKVQDLEKIYKIFHASEMSNELWKKYSQSVIKNESELWRYISKLSYFPEINNQ